MLCSNSDENTRTRVQRATANVASGGPLLRACITGLPRDGIVATLGSRSYVPFCGIELMSCIYRAATLERFKQQREVWSSNSALRALYAYWYAEVAEVLKPVITGTVLEIGSGAGFARQFLPFLRTSDTIKADWHDYEIDATKAWPFANGTLDGVLVFDVLHHLSAPGVLFREVSRTLRIGGRLVLMEPYVSLCSYPVYRFLHEEGLDTSVRPLVPDHGNDKDPFAGNQALVGLIFGRFGEQFRQQFPELELVERRLYSGFSYVASGGFSGRCALPHSIWLKLLWLDRHVPSAVRSLVAFRTLIVLERVATRPKLEAAP